MSVQAFKLIAFLVGLSVAFAKDDPKLGPCDNLTLVSREEWRARPSESRFEIETPLSVVIIIHTASPPCVNKASCVRYIQFQQSYQMDDLGWGDIAYNFLIGGDGRAYVGGGWTEEGSHSINFNTNSIGIAFLGDYDKVPPSKSMLDAAQNLIACGIKQGYLTPTCKIYGQRDVTCTDSPGQALYDIIKTWKNFGGGRVDEYFCPKSA